MKKKTVTQIWMPLFLSIILVVVAAVFLFRPMNGNAVQRMQWADISSIYLIFPLILILPLVFIFCLLSSRLVHNFHKGSKDFLITAQSYTNSYSEKIQSFCHRISATNFQPESWSKSIRNKQNHE